MIGGLIGHGGRFLWGLALGAGVLVLGSKFFNGARPTKEETVPQDAVGFEAAVVIPSPEPRERVVVNAFPVVPEPGVSEAVLEPVPASEAPPARRSRAAPSAATAGVRKGRGSDPHDISARAEPAPKRAKAKAEAPAEPAPKQAAPKQAPLKRAAPKQAAPKQAAPKRERTKAAAPPAADAAAPAAPKARARKAAHQVATAEATAQPARRRRKASVEGKGTP